MKIRVIAVGKSREAWLVEALAEYEKRLRGVEWLIARDDRQLMELVSRERGAIGLDPAGKTLDSVGFSKMLEDRARVTFVIGGPEGLPEGLDLEKVSLSPMTMTHQIVRLVLLEQIYRAQEISRGSQYHK